MFEMRCVDKLLGIALNVLRGHPSIVDSAVNQLIGCVRGVIRDLDVVGSFVPHLAISPFFLRDTSSRNSAEVSGNFDEFGHPSC